VDEIEVETMSGRAVRGHLSAISPGYTHSFGTPPPEIVGIGRELRARVAAYRAEQAEGEAAPSRVPGTAGPEAGE
jgi:hypothetical protein